MTIKGSREKNKRLTKKNLIFIIQEQKQNVNVKE